MNKIPFKDYLRTERLSCGVSQGRLASAIGITRQYVNELETGKANASEKLKLKLIEGINKLRYNTPLFLLIDYLRVRLPTTDAPTVIQDLLQLKIEYLYHEEYAFYGYEEQYSFGDIVLMASNDTSKGLLLELKGKGCRQLETFLKAQNRSWYDFIRDCVSYGGIIKRLDLAINDVAGILDIPLLIEKSCRGELITPYQKFQSIHAGELGGKTKKDRDKGSTLYIGSRSSQQYFCLYQKDKEQHNRGKQSGIKNRFEIRLKDKKAERIVQNLLETENPEEVIFTIINSYMRFVDTDRNHAVSHMWEWFTGKGRKPLELEMREEFYTMEHTIRWLRRQVAPSLELIRQIDEINGSHMLEELKEQAVLKEYHNIQIKQMATEIDNIIITADSYNKDSGIF